MAYYIGLMSGTSLDGVDGVLLETGAADAPMQQLADGFVAFGNELRAALFALQFSGFDEIHRSAQAANYLVLMYAECVLQLLRKTGLRPDQVRAVGVHGQTVRHRPEFGYTTQLNAPALLAELVDIDVIADFRSRDIAAGGQGAPLVPAYHRSVFGVPGVTRVVANIGGIANISTLLADGSTGGFDTGPGNVLMDLWTLRHQTRPYDENGAWARQGQIDSRLLAQLLDDPFFARPPPKSTGRDLFHNDWLAHKLSLFESLAPVDVQTTLCALTAQTLATAILAHASDVRQVFICGGGAYNSCLIEMIETALNSGEHPVSVDSTAVLGVSPSHVEAQAFAWLAWRHDRRLSGNLAEVTGAAGERILGAHYPH